MESSKCLGTTLPTPTKHPLHRIAILCMEGQTHIAQLILSCHTEDQTELFGHLRLRLHEPQLLPTITMSPCSLFVRMQLCAFSESKGSIDCKTNIVHHWIIVNPESIFDACHKDSAQVLTTKKGRTSPRDRMSSRNLNGPVRPKAICHSKNRKNLQNASKCIKKLWSFDLVTQLGFLTSRPVSVLMGSCDVHCCSALHWRQTSSYMSHIVAQSHPGFDDNFPSENFACPHRAFSWYYWFLRGFALPWLNRGVKRLLLRCYPDCEVWFLIVSLPRLSAAVKSGHASNATPLQS